jgi:hypothetical protein
MQGRSFFSTACASLAGSAATYSQARKAAITAAAAAIKLAEAKPSAKAASATAWILSLSDLTRGDVLDDFTLYWLTNTGTSAARFYWELHFSLYNGANVSVPAAVSVFPGENYQAPRSWAERAYHKLIYFNELDKADTMRPGNSRSSFRKKFARASDHCGHMRQSRHNELRIAQRNRERIPLAVQ